MSKIKYPSSFLRGRRIMLGLEPCEVARACSLNEDTYRQIECRGQLPEQHFAVLSAALNVSVETLKAEKVATIAESLLGIDKRSIHDFVDQYLKKDG